MARRSLLSILSVLLALFSILWMLALNQMQFNPIRAKNILLVIAHPDDEVMFFGPSLIGITEPSANNAVNVLCLSNGNATGLGKIRESELVESVGYFGIRDVETINHPKLQDSMTAEWPFLLLQTVIMRHVELLSIDTIITFDKYGISGHSNHIAVSMACASVPVDVYILKSVPLWRKYLSIFDSLVVFFQKASNSRAVYINPPTGTLQVQKAMRRGHKSQMLWYRWGWILFSRYLIINELELITRT